LIKALILAAITCLSTLGGVYGAMALKSGLSAKAAGHDDQNKLQIMKTRMVSVPLVKDGELLGYIVTRLQFVADTDLVKLSSIQPEAFVADEAFRTIYESTPDDIRSPRKQALRQFTAEVVSATNKRVGRDVIKDVMIDSWTFLSKQDMVRKNDHN
jgi:hypothetical protein